VIKSAQDKIAQLEATNPDLEQALSVLRTLSLDEYGEFLLSVPNSHIPRLSALFPHATPDAVQKRWTGSSGWELLRQSTSFMSFLASEYTIQTDRSIRNAKILDFGVGWGRLMRLLPFFTDPAAVFGIDPWQESLDHAKAARLLGRLEKSESEPTDLPFPGEQFDLVYAFSVFTHINSRTAQCCLSAIRKRMQPNGLAIITVRPPEFWDYLATQRGRTYPSEMRAHNETGYAFIPSTEGSNYGETSMTENYLKSIAHGWRIVRMGATLIDPMQVFVTLKPENL
jgi:SAM-dependent methyltransferase